MGNTTSKAPHNRDKHTYKHTYKHKQSHKQSHNHKHKHRHTYKHRGGTTPLSKLNPAYHLNPPPSPKPKLYRKKSIEESLLLEVLDESVPPMFRHLKHKKKTIAEQKAQKSAK